MAVYQGRESCTAKKEGIYVKRIRKKGVDTVYEAVALAYMVLRDYRRGYTWEQGSCRKIRMSEELFKKRIRFIYRLACVHGADRETRKIIKKLCIYVLKKKRLPKTIPLPDGRRVSTKHIIKTMIVKAKKARGRDHG